MSSSDTMPPPPPPNCGITKHSADRLPPDVLIVLDRSTSMDDPVKPVTDVGADAVRETLASMGAW